MLVTTVANAANLLSKQYIGSVYYNFYDDGTAEATYGTLQSPENYSGDIQIRSSVTLNGKSYAVTAIGEDAFYKSVNMTSLFIPNTVKTIGASAFSGCTKLADLEIPNSVTSIGDKAFLNCKGLKSIDLSELSIKSLLKGLFGGCVLNTVHLPKTLESIPDEMFSNSNINSIIIPGKVTKIGKDAFNNSGLKTIDLSEVPMKTLSVDLFNGCSLDYVYLPNTLESIPDKMFFNSTIKSIKIPSKVKEIGERAFYQCGSLETVDMTDAPLKTFGAYAFAECRRLSTINLPKTLEIIPEYAFYCVGGGDYYSNYGDRLYDKYNSSCKKIVIPNSVKRIEKYAFANFSNLTSIDFGESVEYIGDYAFYFWPFKCSGCIPIEHEYQCGDFSWCTYIEYLSGVVFNETLNEIILPNSVKTIGACAFANHTKLSRIEFGNSLITIGNYAFSGHGSGYDGSYYVNDFSPDFNNSSLKSLYFPESLVSIGSSAFARCSALTEVDLPSTLQKIGSSSFSRCGSIKSLVIPNSVNIIGNAAFSYCEKLESLEISNSLNTIPDSCFYGCRELLSATIPNSVSSIKKSVFSGCSKMGTVTIPQSVTEISNDVFTGCSECIVYLCNEYISRNHAAFKPVKKVASCDNVPMPVEINYAFFHTGKEQLYNIPENAAYTVTGNRRTEEGTQNVVIALKDGFSWTNGTSDTLVFDFTIYPAKLTPEQTVIKGYLGQTLGDLTLPKGYKWVDSEETVLEYAGESTFAVEYIPEGWTKDPLLIEMTVIVSKIGIEPPVVDLTEFIYNGKEQTFKIIENDIYKVSNPEELTKTDAGIYYIYVILRNKANYEWSDGTTDAKMYRFTINKASVKIPEAGESKFVYTGDELIYKIEENPLYTISDNVQTYKGNYEAKVSLNDVSNYIWEDGTTEPKYYPFMITLPMVDIPEADPTEFVYNGKEQTYNIKENPLYEITGNAGTDVGWYYVYVSLKDKNNYVWSDGTTSDKYYSFQIKKLYVKKPNVDYQTFTYTGDPITYEIPENENYTVTDNVQINAGYHGARISLNDPYNCAWEDGTTYNLWYEFYIEKKKVVIPSRYDGEFTYNGKPQTYPIASNGAYTTVIGYDYNSSWYGSDSTQTNAGSYYVILELKDKENMVWVESLDSWSSTTSNQVYKFDINRAQVTSFPAGLDPKELNLKATYGDQLYDVPLPNEYYWTYPDQSVGETGEKYFTACYNPLDAYNYVETIVDLPVRVDPKKVAEPKEDPTLFYYIAKPQVYSLETNDLYTVKNNVQTNVGTHDVVVSLKDKANYAWGSTGKSDDLIYPFVISKSNEAIFEYGYNPNEIHPKVQYGQKLGDVMLPTRFSWKEPETIADKIGDNKYVVVYTPADPDNYNSVETEIVVNVTKRRVSFPAKDSRMFVYNGKAQTYEVGDNDLFQVANNVQTNAGRYDVIVSLVDKDHYEWMDGTTDDIYQDFIIRTKSVEMPSVDSKSFVYDGKSHSLVIPTSPNYTISGNNRTDAGRYEVSISLADKKNYVWENNTTADIVATFSISKIKVDMPAADNTSFSYTGEPLTYKIEANPLYTVAGNVQTAAGRYDVKVSLNNTRNYEWMDGSTDNLVYNFYIKDLVNQSTLEIVKIPNVSNRTFVYDTKEHSLGLVDTDEYTVTDEGGVEVGRYTATLTLTDKNKYIWENGSADKVTITYVVTKAQVATPARDTRIFTYNGENQEFVVDESSLYKVSNNIQKNAGRHEVAISLNDTKNYEWEDGSSDDLTMIFKIGKAKVTAPAADASKFTYTGEAQTYTIAKSSLYKVSNNVQTKVGSYEVVVSLTDAQNYMWTDGTTNDLYYNFVIRAEQANVTFVDIPVVTTKKFIYNGKSQSLLIPVSDDYTIINNKGTDAGRYVVTLALRNPNTTVWSDGTKDDIQIVFNIARATVEIPEVDHTRYAYNGEAQTYMIPSNANYTVSGNVQKEAGNYEVVVALKDVKNFMWSDGTVDDLSYSFVIRGESTQKTMIPVPTVLSNNFVYDGTEKSLAIAENPAYTISGNSGVHAGRYTVKVSLANTDTAVWDNGLSDDILLTFTIAKAQVEIPAAVKSNYVYNGENQTYDLIKSKYYTIRNNVKKEAGRYDVTVSLNNTKDYEWTNGTFDDVNYRFVIAKAQVVEPAADQSKFVYNGNEQTYKIDPSDLYTTYGTTKTMPGKYEVLVSLNDVKNYEWSNGTTDALSYNFVIRAEETELKPIAIPTVLTKNFIYDGNKKSLAIASSKDYSIKGNSGINAGRYTVILSLTDPDKTVWADGSSDDIKMSFTIARAQVEMPAADIHKYVYDVYGRDQVYGIDESPYYTISNNIQNIAGRYNVTVSLEDTKNYEWTDGSIDDLSYTFAINKRQVIIPSASDSMFIYNGEDQTYPVEIYVPFDDASALYTVYTVTNNVHKDAGRYDVNISLIDPKNYEWVGGSIEDVKMPFTINKAQVEIPVADDSKFVFNGGKHVYEIAEDSRYTVDGNVQTMPGKYEVLVSLNDAKNYEWANGTTETQVYSFVIRAQETDIKSVEIPTVLIKNFIYDGNDKSLDIKKSDYYTISGNRGVDVGRYTVIISLNDPDKTVWSDGSTDDIKMTFSIDKAQVDAPDPDTKNFVYTGKMQVYRLKTDTAYTVSGVTRINAGTSVVSVALNDTKNYVWSDGTIDVKKYNFTIAKASVKVPAADKTTYYYDGTQKVYDIEESDLYVVKGNKQTMPGKYEVSVELSDKSNYLWSDGTSDALTYNFVIRYRESEKQSIEIPDVLVRTFTYNGDAQSLAVKSNKYYTVSGNSGVNVGRYSVKLSLTDKDSTVWSDGSTEDIIMTFQIAKAQVEIPSADTNKFVFNAEYQTYNVENSDLYSVAGYRQINVGNHDVVISLKDTKNYEWSDGTVSNIVYSFMIHKQEVDITTVEIPVAPVTKFIYDSNSHTLAIPENVNYTVVGDTKTAAGKYNARVSLKDKETMVWEDGSKEDIVIPFVISKATVRMPVVDNVEFEYDGKPHTLEIAKSPLYRVDGNVQTLVGRHLVSVSLVDRANYMWSDGVSDDLQFSFIIKVKEKITLPVSIPVVRNANFIYNGLTQTLEIKENPYYTVSGNSQSLAGSYTATISLNDKETTTWEDGTVTDIVIPFTIAKSKIAVPYVEETSFVYDGSTQTYPLGSNRDYVVTENSYVEAGNYQARLTLRDKINTVWESGSTDDVLLPFSIAKVVLDKPVVDSTSFVYDSDTVAVKIQTNNWYTVTGQKALSAGTYQAKVSLKDKANTIWSDGTMSDVYIPFVIEKSNIAMPSADSTRFVYNGELQTYTVVENPNYVVSGNTNVNAGDYQAVVSLKDKINTVWANGTSDDIILPYSIAKVEVVKPTADSTEFVYNSDTMTVEIPSNVLYNVSGNRESKAGNYAATVSLIDKINTVWNDGTTDDVLVPFTIAKASVAMPASDTTKFIYSGDTMVYAIAENELYSVRGNLQSKIGRYSVVVSLNDIENYSWSDGSTLDLIYPFIIGERDIVMNRIARPYADTTVLVYNGQMQTFNIVADSNCVVEGNVRMNSGRYLATVSLADRMTMVWEDGTSDDIVIPFVIVKSQVEKPVADTTEFFFNGEAQTYNIPADSAYVVEGNVQTNVGRYDIYVSLVDINNYEWSDGTTGDVSYRFVISHPVQIDTVVPENVKLTEDVVEVGDTVSVYDRPGDYLFDITFDSLAREEGFKDIFAVEGEDGISFNVPDDVDPGHYSATVTIKDIDGKVIEKEIEFSVAYPSYFIKKLMNDILSVDNTNREFVSYQWYKNGEKINGANNQFFCDLEGVYGAYKVEVVTVSGDTLFIAEREFSAPVSSFDVTLSKNPVEINETFTVFIEGATNTDILKNSSLVVYDIQGVAVINKVGIEKNNELSVGNVGEYIVVVRNSVGQTVSKHLLVK